MGITILLLLICFFASVLGSVCGIGGGVIIKPVLDAFHVMTWPPSVFFPAARYCP